MEWHWCGFNADCWTTWIWSPATAAWVQAVVTFLAVIVAIVVPYCQNRYFQKVRAKEKNESRDEALIVVAASLEQVLHTLLQIESDLVRGRIKGLISSYVEMIRSARETLVKSPLQDVGRSEVAGLALRVVRATAPVQELLRKLSITYEQAVPVHAFASMEDEHAWGSVQYTVIRILADTRGVYEVIRFFLENGVNTKDEVPEFKPMAIHSDEKRTVKMIFTLSGERWSVQCAVIDSDNVVHADWEQLDTVYPGWHQAYFAGLSYADRLVGESASAREEDWSEFFVQ